ncbi:MAG: imidazole glycerol phosphate synthase subunit HisH [Lachnospiraceae bacterium]|nr:imidazole glycerol phosphate synthase subunit HisH [Lachnospiraceae bacterium]
MIAVIDYDAGNIKSVQKALEFLGKQAVVTRDRNEILTAERVILPGVGNFGDAMAKLKNFGLVSVLEEVAKQGTPFLGICLGLQLLFEESEESPGVKGLGLLPGRIVRIPKETGLKIPQIGWNALKYPSKGRLFEKVPEGAYVYFVHSYYLQAQEKETVKATVEYGVTVEASVEKDNIFACQFHPEKSSEAGLQILRNFMNV